ncbi:MAG TPA: hypothetical protein VGC57_14990, partial [Cellulomonas sp.]
MVALLVLALTACTGGSLDDATPTPGGTASSVAPADLRAEVAAPDAPVTLVPDGTAAATALATSAALYVQAPVVVLVGTDPADLAPAASAAVALGGPVLPVDDAGAGSEAIEAELDRLGATQVVAVGDQAAEALGPDGGLAQVAEDLTVHAVATEDGADDLADLGIDVGAPRATAATGLAAAVAGLGRPAPDLLLADGGPADDAPATSAPSATVGPTWSPTGSATGAASATAATTGLGWTRIEPRDPAEEHDPASPSGTEAPGTGDVTTAASAADALVHVEPPRAPESTALLVDLAADPDGRTTAAVATARAAGIPVVDVPGGDPRASSAAVQALDGVRTVVAIGSSFGSAEVLAPRVAGAATGVQLPGGGQLVFPTGPDGAPDRLYVALYGTPGTPALGVLGEQDVPATIARARQTADQYTALTDRTVVPTLEIIATIASSGPEADGSYSRARSIDELRPLVEAAGDAGMAVVIDLQPGRTDFLTQAQQYADLLAYPHVGLALDPEWRLAPDQVHLRQIGSVGIDEVNAVGDWLAQFTRDRALPQKMFLLHQFSLRMITERERLDTSHDELAVLIHADGQGSQPAKTGTWDALRQGAPTVHWGWKNFYDEDVPMLDPAQTMQVQP